MQQETKLFVGSQLHDNRSVMELLTADYSFLNQRLAAHYGLRNIYGDHFRRVTFTDGTRGGLLGQSSVLTVTSYPNRTSVDDARPLASRQSAWGASAAAAARYSCAQGSRSRGSAADRCASGWRCIGRIRRAHRATSGWIRSVLRSRISTPWESGARPATARRSIRRRRSLTGPDSWASTGLRTLMVSHKEDFVRTLTGKLLAYAIGRGLDHHDMAAIRRIARDAAAADYSWSSIVSGIVKSTPFRMAVATGERTGTSAETTANLQVATDLSAGPATQLREVWP